LEQLGLDVGLLLSQAVNFVLLVILLSAFLYKPVLGTLEERAARIKKGMEDADRAGQLLADTKKDHEAEMERARKEAHEVVERATLSAQQERQEILAQARQEAHEIVLRAQQQAQHELQEGRITLGQQVVDLAIAAASRVTRENLDGEKQRALIREFITEVDHQE
jgi:F-type H+-transporting ATPase subunit b